MRVTTDTTTIQRFVGGVSKVLNKQSRILEKVKGRCWKPQKYKFGVQVPINVAKAKKIDNP